VTVDLDSLLGHPGGLGGETGGPVPLDPETCRRLACDGAVTRVLVTRHPIGHAGTQDTLGARLRVAATRLPPALGGAPAQPLAVGRTSRVVSAAQRAALVVRDGGWVLAGCDRPPAWCEPTIWSTGCTAAPPTWPTWRWCAGPITGRCTRAAGGCTATPTAAWQPAHRIEDPSQPPPQPDPARAGDPSTPGASLTRRP
jgi:hypothetical protein